MTKQFNIAAVTRDGINKALARIAAAFLGVIAVQLTEATSSVAANGPFQVTHNLGHTPIFAIALPFADTRVWATDEDVRTWDSRSVTLRASAASTRIRVLIVRWA